MLRSNVKKKLDPFGNVVNLSDNLFSNSKFSLLYKSLKNFGSTENIQINLDLKAIATGNQRNYLC